MPKGTVLVIDDDPGIVELVEAALSTQGYHVLAAVNGPALQIAHDQDPDVILLDLTMPGMDGMEVSRLLRADPKTAGIPIVVMSALERIQGASAKMAADDHLSKPFKLAQLYAVVARWVP